MKKLIGLSVLIFSSLGSWLGTSLDHGNGLGGWTILLTTVGGLVGVWIGYTVGKNYL